MNNITLDRDDLATLFAYSFGARDEEEFWSEEAIDLVVDAYLSEKPRLTNFLADVHPYYDFEDFIDAIDGRLSLEVKEEELGRGLTVQEKAELLTAIQQDPDLIINFRFNMENVEAFILW